MASSIVLTKLLRPGWGPEAAEVTFCPFPDLPPHLRGTILESLADKLCILDDAIESCGMGCCHQRILDCHR